MVKLTCNIKAMSDNEADQTFSFLLQKAYFQIVIYEFLQRAIRWRS